MAELTALRARLKDRQVKDGALGSVEVSLCLDQDLVLSLLEVEAERDRLAATGVRQGDPDSLAGEQIVPADTSELDAAVEAKRTEVRDATVWLKFRAVSSVRYQELVNQYDDPEAERYAFMNSLAEACLVEAWSGDDQVAGPGVADPLLWEEIYPEITTGQWDTTTQQVFGLNKRVLDAPFSRKPLSTTKN